jgi:hypothetical protein
MKSERRHELQHNALADWIVKTGKALQPYQNLILAAIVVLVVGVAAYTWWSQNTESQAGQAWYDLNAGLASGNREKLAKVIEDHPDSRVGETAAVLLADLRLNQGCNQRFLSKALAEPELSKAAELYEADLKVAQSDFLRQRATFGLARALESKGDLTAARKHYEEVVTKWRNGAYAAVAKQRLDDLARDETKRMYDDFRNFDRKPDFGPSTTLPGLDLSPGGLPGLPGEPAVEPNTLPGLSPLEGTKAADEKKAVDNKKPGEAKKPAAEKKPAEGKKPADSKKPVETKKPAESKKPTESKKP